LKLSKKDVTKRNFAKGRSKLSPSRKIGILFTGKEKDQKAVSSMRQKGGGGGI